MNLEPFTGPGSTPSRRRVWDKITQAVTSLQKLEGKNVSVDEHQGYGTVINVPRGRGPTGGGACCIDGECSILSADDCASGGGNYLGDDTTCEDVDCTTGGCCFCGDCGQLTEDGCVPFGGQWHGYGTVCLGVCAPDLYAGDCLCDGCCVYYDDEGNPFCVYTTMGPCFDLQNPNPLLFGRWECNFCEDDPECP